MIASILTSMVAYISTNIDDIFVLMILLAQTGSKQRLIAGHFLGVGLITLISMLGAFGLQNLPLKYVGILGLGYSHTKQVHNQITTGHSSSSMMNFKVNILSIGLGVAFYI